MDLAIFQWLLSDAGQALLAEAMAGDLSGSSQLSELTRLRRFATPAQATAAYEIALLRRRAATKFSNAATMYFTREALEQASSERIASYRALRYQDAAVVADLCCGIGGDSLALAQYSQVIAVDRDPLRLAMATANAHACGRDSQIAVYTADLEQTTPPTADALFFDPARRSNGKRLFRIADYQPSIALMKQWQTHTPAIGIKIAPGVSDDDLAPLGEREVEFISVDGELKEAMLWFGPLARLGRRATLLTTDPVQPAVSMFNPLDDAQVAPVSEPSCFLYEPDPSILRARLVAPLALQLGAAQIDRDIAYLTADHAIETSFARCWRILEWLPFQLKRLRARLRALDAGAVTVKKRGSPLDSDALARQLSNTGLRPLVVVLTRVANQPAALICEGPIHNSYRRASAVQ